MEQGERDVCQTRNGSAGFGCGIFCGMCGARWSFRVQTSGLKTRPPQSALHSGPWFGFEAAGLFVGLEIHAETAADSHPFADADLHPLQADGDLPAV